MYIYTQHGCIHIRTNHGGVSSTHVVSTPQINPVMGWLELVGSIKLYVSFAKEPYKRDVILQKRPII